MPKEPEDDATILRRYGIEPDPVIEAYKKDVDRTLLRENLRRTVQQRMDNLAALQDFMAELRRAGREVAQRSARNPERVPGTSRDDSAGQSPAPSTRERTGDR